MDSSSEHDKLLSPSESYNILPFPKPSEVHSSSEHDRVQVKKKREDLQCWRALAIIAVLLFHIWPETFPNGYLGVDIFFVLSGFLMATIVHEKQRINKDTTIDFYYRRIKRIVPIYLIFVVATVFWISQILWKEEFDDFMEDSFWASGFLTNIQDFFEKEDYFDMKPPGWTSDDDYRAALHLMRDQPFKDPNCINNEKSYTNIVPRGYLRFCETRNPRSTQNLTALVLGNSHCLAVGPIINQDKRFSTVVRVSGDTCHFPSRAKREFCNDMITMDFEILEKLKPDIVFLFFAYVGKMIETPKTKITAKDPRFLYLNNTIAKMSKYAKVIIINDIDIRFPYSVTKVFLRRKRKGLETDSLKETGTIEKVSKEPEIRRCLDLLLQYCPICVIVRPRDAFCSNGICDPIDRKYNLPMFRDSGHVQGLGRRHYKPFIDKAISQALDIIGNSSHTDEH